MSEKFNCPAISKCSGCAPLAPAIENQQQIKIDQFTRLLKLSPEVQVMVEDLGEGFVRERLDFTWSEGSFGLRETQGVKIVDLPVCHQLTPELQNALTEFRKIQWPVQKGSVRLRVNSRAERGVWLDFSNLDIQKLFDEKTHLHELLKAFSFVEVGQKRKKLIWNESENRFQLLKDPVFHTWTQSFARGQVYDLQSCIGDFTQTGRKANQAIARVLEDWLTKIKPQQTLEWGAGIGTLTFPLCAFSEQVHAVELEERAVEALRKTQSLHQIENLKIDSGDFQKQVVLPLAADLLVLNPPRSGVRDFLRSIPDSVQHVIYMTCFPESLALDAENLIAHNFKPVEARLIDQFPQTPHAEWLTLWSRL